MQRVAKPACQQRLVDQRRKFARPLQGQVSQQIIGVLDAHLGPAIADLVRGHALGGLYAVPDHQAEQDHKAQKEIYRRRHNTTVKTIIVNRG